MRNAGIARFRARLLRAIREWFHREGVTEVVTGSLRPFGVTDPNLHNLQVAAGSTKMFLQTSPEYAMKKLIAATGDSIYQICPAFRGGESGPRHRVEFQMLEWYRVGFDLNALADDLDGLLAFISPAPEASRRAIRRCRYRDLFMDRLGVNPHAADIESLKPLAADHRLAHLDESARLEDYLDGLFSTVVEPELRDPTIVFEYPSCQAALARLKANEEGEQVADRFEFYAAGIEIANAYRELSDEAELRQRFTRNNQVRAERGQQPVPLDEDFLAAMKHLPDCSGAALGIERLMMWLLGANELP